MSVRGVTDESNNSQGVKITWYSWCLDDKGKTVKVAEEGSVPDAVDKLASLLQDMFTVRPSKLLILRRREQTLKVIVL